jgi:hypothetical protein
MSMREPIYVGTLLVLPLEGGRKAFVDPKSITSVTQHRTHEDQIVVRCGGDFHFVDVDIDTMHRWLDDAIGKGSQKKGGL